MKQAGAPDCLARPNQLQQPRRETPRAKPAARFPQLRSSQLSGPSCLAQKQRWELTDRAPSPARLRLTNPIYYCALIDNLNVHKLCDEGLANLRQQLLPTALQDFYSVADFPSVRSGSWRRHNDDHSLIAILASQANANLRIMWPASARREAVRELNHELCQPVEIRNGHH